MQNSAFRPTAKTRYEPESQQEHAQGTRSPCTPSLQCIEEYRGEANTEVDRKRADVLNWSPHTPETLPVVSIREAVTAISFNSNDLSEEAVLDPIAVEEKNGNGSEKNDQGDEVLAALQSESAPQEKKRNRSNENEAPNLIKESTGREVLTFEQQQQQPSNAAATSSSPTFTHVDPLAKSSAFARDSLAPTDTTATSDGPSTACKDLDGVKDDSMFFPRGTDTNVISALVVIIVSYCDLSALVQFMRLSRTSHQLATSDEVWKPILYSMNLSPLLAAYDRNSDYYDFFLREIVTTRALHGHYTFQAANKTSDSNGSGSRVSGGCSNRDHNHDDDSLQEDVFNIASLQLLISAASLGQSNHLIGRVQLLLTYKNDSMEVLQGSCRFSIFRRCFSLCCSAFGTVKRGPVFTVAVATVTKPWANEGFQHFSEHKNGIRLVMTPVLWEGQSPGSQITEKDILVVSRPRPETATAATAAATTSTVSVPESPMSSRC